MKCEVVLHPIAQQRHLLETVSMLQSAQLRRAIDNPVQALRYEHIPMVD
jgi:hypothetical protein